MDVKIHSVTYSKWPVGSAQSQWVAGLGTGRNSQGGIGGW